MAGWWVVDVEEAAAPKGVVDRQVAEEDTQAGVKTAVAKEACAVVAKVAVGVVEVAEKMVVVMERALWEAEARAVAATEVAAREASGATEVAAREEAVTVEVVTAAVRWTRYNQRPYRKRGEGGSDVNAHPGCQFAERRESNPVVHCLSLSAAVREQLDRHREAR